MPVFGSHWSVMIQKTSGAFPSSFVSSYFLPIINSWSHLSTSNLVLCPWLFFHARLEFAWYKISIFVVRRGGSFSKGMSTKSCNFPCSTTGQGARTVIVIIHIYVFIYRGSGWCMWIKEKQASALLSQRKYLRGTSLIITPKYCSRKGVPVLHWAFSWHHCLMGFFWQPHPVTVEPHSCGVSPPAPSPVADWFHITGQNNGVLYCC